MAISFDLFPRFPRNFSLTFRASSGYLAVLWGRHDRGFVLESGWGPNTNGKFLEVWRNDYCGSLNVAALGARLIVSGGKSKRALGGAV